MELLDETSREILSFILNWLKEDIYNMQLAFISPDDDVHYEIDGILMIFGM